MLTVSPFKKKAEKKHAIRVCEGKRKTVTEARRRRRRWAVTAMRGFARLRLSRARYVQDVDVRRGRELAAAAGAAMIEDAYLPAHSPAAFQAGVEGQGGAGHGPTMALALG